jgi:hypothetical protein
VEVKKGKIFSLFHGTQGSRNLPAGIWLKADKKIVRDGSCANNRVHWDTPTGASIDNIGYEEKNKAIF